MHSIRKSSVEADAFHNQTDKVWLASYPRGVPAEINPEQHRSLVAFFESTVRRYGDRPAFSSFGTTLSYRDLDRHSRAFAAFLQHTLHLVKGERIAVMMPNVLQYPTVLFAALRAGLVVVNVNPLYTSRELAHQLIDADACAIVVMENFAHVVADCIDQTSIRHVVVTRMGDMLRFPKSVMMNFVVKNVRKLVPLYELPGAVSFRKALDDGQARTLTPVNVCAGDLAFLQYTGGTTGLAKGAMLTHRNMVANVEQAAAWLRPCVKEGVEVIVTALPLYHIFALTANCLTFMKIGGRNLLIANPRDLWSFVQTLRKVRFTAITGVNTLFNGLLNAPGLADIDFSSLKIALAGGAALQEAVAKRWKAATGATIIEAYGLTEAAPAVCINPLDLPSYNGCIGLPIPSTEVSIRDDQGRLLGTNVAGEVWVRGPQVMRGYWMQPEETAAVLTEDGWLRTGDIGEMRSDGYFRLLDRKKDMILVSGFNVYPNEVEDAIAELPGVDEVGVIGVPDEQTGEAVTAVIVKKDTSLTENEIRAHCRNVLTGYKRPRHIVFDAEIPKNNIGKILRRELRARYVTNNRLSRV